MTNLRDSLRRMTEREQAKQSAPAPPLAGSFAPAPYAQQPRLPRCRKLFTPFEVWLAVMAACMAQTGALALVWAVQG